MSLFKTREINNAIYVLQELLEDHYSHLEISSVPEHLVYDNNDKTLMFEASSTRPLAKEFILQFTIENRACLVRAKKDEDENSMYILLLKKESIELLILSANLRACYILNHDLRYYSKSGMQPWVVWGKRDEAQGIVPHLRSYQRQPDSAETEQQEKDRKNKVIHSIDKMWHKMTGSERGKARSIDFHACNTFTIGGTLSLEIFPGQGGGCLIFENFLIARIENEPRTDYIDLSSDDEVEAVKQLYRPKPAAFKYELPSLDLNLDSDDPDEEQYPRVKRMATAAARP